jgi:hypothetical protein
MYIYWTGEPVKIHALMEFAFNERYIETAIEHFKNISSLIQRKSFEIGKKPAMEVC